MFFTQDICFSACLINFSQSLGICHPGKNETVFLKALFDPVTKIGVFHGLVTPLLMKSFFILYSSSLNTHSSVPKYFL
tara:strand:+ start:246 stop:479 length:234 start_codon:yes stop_codon:yes gene_type:complete